MSEKWYVYRYSLSDPVLKSSETELDITPGNDVWLARFALSGRNGPVEVQMVVDPNTGAWYGNWQKNERESFDFQWARIGEGPSAFLIGRASLRNKIARRDFFVAVQSRRTIQLSPDRASYDFRESILTPLVRKPHARGGSISVDPRGKKIVWRNPPQPGGDIPEDIYELEDFSSYEHGCKLAGRNSRGSEIRLWIPPIDSTGGLLSTGYLHDDNQETGGCQPGDPDCTLDLHGC